MNHTTQLPIEIILDIISFLNHLTLEDVSAFSNVNTTWRFAISCLYAKKPRTITFGFVGVENSGKSTLLGRMLDASGFLSEKTIEKYRKPPQNAASAEKAHYLKYGTLLDTTKEELKAMKTLHVRRRSIFTNPENSYSLIDTPGSLSMIKNFIRGISQCNAVVIVLDASNFKQSYRRVTDIIQIAYIMSVHNFIVVVNKLDLFYYNKRLETFIEIKRVMDKYFLSLFGSKTYGVDVAKIPYIPTSGLNDINVFENRTIYSWYPESKFPSLWDQIHITNHQLRTNPFSVAMRLATSFASAESAMLYGEEEEKTSETEQDIRSKLLPYDPLVDFDRLLMEQFRLSVNQVYKKNKLEIVSGVVLCGTVSVGDTVLIEPYASKQKVLSLQVLKRNVDTAMPGDYVSISLDKFVAKREKIDSVLSRGDVLSSPLAPEYEIEEFEVKLIMNPVIKQSLKVIKPGWKPLVFNNCAYGDCELMSIESAFNKSGKKGADTSFPEMLTRKQGGIVRFKALSPLCLVPIDRCPRLSRVVFRDGCTQAVAVGYVTKVTYNTNRQSLSVKSKSATTAPVAVQQKSTGMEPFKRTLTTEDIWSGVRFSMDLWQSTN